MAYENSNHERGSAFLCASHRASIWQEEGCNEGGMDGCHDNPGKTLHNCLTLQSKAMAICLEGQMPAYTLNLETPLAYSGASTCLSFTSELPLLPTNTRKGFLRCLIATTLFSSRFLDQEGDLLCGLLFNRVRLKGNINILVSREAK